MRESAGDAAALAGMVREQRQLRLGDDTFGAPSVKAVDRGPAAARRPVIFESTGDDIPY